MAIKYSLINRRLKEVKTANTDPQNALNIQKCGLNILSRKYLDFCQKKNNARKSHTQINFFNAKKHPEHDAIKKFLLLLTKVCNKMSHFAKKKVLLSF